MKQDLFDNVLNENSNKDVVDFSEKGRTQFLEELQEAIHGFAKEEIKDEEEIAKETQTEEAQMELIFKENDEEEQLEKIAAKERVQKMEEMEVVMNKGMEFLSGLLKMSTGQELNSQGNKIEIDKNTGEVVMRFKLDF